MNYLDGRDLGDENDFPIAEAEIRAFSRLSSQGLALTYQTSNEQVRGKIDFYLKGTSAEFQKDFRGHRKLLVTRAGEAHSI